MQALEYDDGPLVWVCAPYTHIQPGLLNKDQELKRNGMT